MQKIVIVIISFLFLIVSCSENSNSNIMISHDQKLFNEFTTRYNDTSDIDEKIIWADSGIKLFSGVLMAEQLKSLYMDLSNTTEDEFFREYLFFLLSDIFWKLNDTESFVYFAGRMSEKSYQLQYDGQFITYINDLRIIKLDNYEEFRIKAYNELLLNYRNQIDEVLLLYELSKLYKSIYNLDDAIPVMRELLKVANSLPLKDDRIDFVKIKDEIDFYFSKKIWINQDLSQLITSIKYAVNSYNISLLSTYITKIGFFIRFFNSSDDKWSDSNIALNRRFIGRYIQFATTFEDISNENEVYLETKGWLLPQMITWYFYFKRIDYPYDEKINGGWEWKGIYLGTWL